jgi:hypothetical protein
LEGLSLLTTVEFGAADVGNFGLVESRANRMSLSRTPAPRFSVEFAWSDGERKLHSDLREREAFRLFDDFAFDAKTALTEDLSVRPVSAVIRNDVGVIVRERDF